MSNQTQILLQFCFQDYDRMVQYVTPISEQKRIAVRELPSVDDVMTEAWADKLANRYVDPEDTMMAYLVAKYWQEALRVMPVYDLKLLKEQVEMVDKLVHDLEQRLYEQRDLIKDVFNELDCDGVVFCNKLEDGHPMMRMVLVFHLSLRLAARLLDGTHVESSGEENLNLLLDSQCVPPYEDLWKWVFSW